MILFKKKEKEVEYSYSIDEEMLGYIAEQIHELKREDFSRGYQDNVIRLLKGCDQYLCGVADSLPRNTHLRDIGFALNKLAWALAEIKVQKIPIEK